MQNRQATVAATAHHVSVEPPVSANYPPMTLVVTRKKSLSFDQNLEPVAALLRGWHAEHERIWSQTLQLQNLALGLNGIRQVERTLL